MRRYPLRGRLLLAGLAAVVIIMTGCSPDPNKEANKIFVEAQQLIEKAEKAPRPADRLPVLRDAEERLKSIISKYPSANLAVQLASGQSVGTISMKGIADQISKAEESACFEAPTRKCLIEQALRAGQAAKNGPTLQFRCGAQTFDRVGFLAQVAVAQKKAGLDEASRTTFEEAFRASEESKQSPDFRIMYFAPALASAGRGDEAIQLLQSVSDLKRRASDLVSIATAQAASGYKTQAAATFDQAVKLMPTETNDPLRASTLLFLARVKITLDRSNEASADIDQARGLIPSNPTFSDIYTLANLADIQASLGRSTDANAALEKALYVSQSQKEKECYIFSIFNGHAPLSAMIDITKFADSVNNENMRSSMLYYATMGKAEAGRIEEAQTISRSIKVDYFDVLALISIARAQDKARLTSQAKQALDMAVRKVQSIQDAGLRAQALLATARAVPE